MSLKLLSCSGAMKVDMDVLLGDYTDIITQKIKSSLFSDLYALQKKKIENKCSLQ